MASAIAMMIGGALTNALAFTGSNFLFSQMSSSAERKRHDLATEKLQHERDVWGEERLERIDYINQKLKEQGHAERTFHSVDEAIREYYEITGEPISESNQEYEWLNDTRPEPQLSEFLDDDQKSNLEKGELALVSVGLLATGYLTYKFI